jgi:hypothetical protein
MVKLRNYTITITERPYYGSRDDNLTENFNKLLLISKPNSDPGTREVTRDRLLKSLLKPFEWCVNYDKM